MIRVNKIFVECNKPYTVFRVA